jgi:tetratricopeptide (TPR) repeat protein
MMDSFSTIVVVVSISAGAASLTAALVGYWKQSRSRLRQPLEAYVSDEPTPTTLQEVAALFDSRMGRFSEIVSKSLLQFVKRTEKYNAEAVESLSEVLTRSYQNLQDLSEQYSNMAHSLVARTRVATERDSEYVYWQAVSLLAETQLRMQKIEEALKLFHQALEIAERIGTSEMVAPSLLNLAYALKEAGRLEESAKFNQRAIELMRRPTKP